MKSTSVENIKGRMHWVLDQSEWVEDEWPCYLSYKKFAIEYNYYEDYLDENRPNELIQNSAMYPSYDGDTDTSEWRNYNVDFSDKEWRKKLRAAMLQYLKDYIKLGRTR